MDKSSARQLIKETFQNPFSKDSFVYFVKNLLNLRNKQIESKHPYSGKYIPDTYKSYISTLERIAKYTDGENEIDILVVKLKKESLLEHARTMQRNFVAWYLNGSRGGKLKDAALVAFVAPDGKDWRFSLVKMEYKLDKTKAGRIRAKEELTPARRYSFLVGVHESSHTAQSRLIPILEDDVNSPTLKQLEESFNIEKVTKEFFGKYHDLYLETKKALDKLIKEDSKIKNDFKQKDISTADFTKKLLGQIVFLYFLQKKGWFGVKRGEDWGSGSKSFLRELFEGKHAKYQNFFNDILEPLFYEALRNDRSHEDHYFSYFNCKIPFLNGGLFDPLGSYDWQGTDIELPNELFSNKNLTKEEDEGDGILDIFDRYNFTVKEDEPLEKEVAVDPEMLGKVFENLLEVKDRKSRGTYYTPREIVHYMCQESLINYLEAETNIKKEKLNSLIHFDQFMAQKMSRPKRLKAIAMWEGEVEEIDKALDNIRIVDPACGSGAFLVGMMQEIIRLRKIIGLFFKTNNFSDYQLKLKSIQNNLYGVDIDSGAVEIAKLRLWLSLVVDEQDIKNIKPLPNLDYKIVCGNSLLGYPYTPSWTKDIEKLKKKFFEATDPKVKQELKNQIDSTIKNFLANSKKSLGYKVDFDFKIFFSEVFDDEDGFDVVIANPPYVDSERMVKEMPELREILTTKYTTAKGNWDLYIPFWELGMKILSTSGIAAFITPNKWLSIKYGEALRKLLKDKILKVGNCDLIHVFEAGNSPVIIFAGKSGRTKKVRIDIFNHDYSIGSSIETYIDKHFSNWGWLLSQNISLILKISNHMSDEKYYSCENPFTVSEAYEVKQLLKDLKTSENYDSNKHFIFINTGTIEKYYSLWGKHLTKYLKEDYLFPIIEKGSFRRKFPKRFAQTNQPKIIISGIRHFECVLDEGGNVVAGKSTIILKNKAIMKNKAILGFLNSKLVSFFIKQAYGSSGIGGGINFTPELIESLPISSGIRPADENKIIKLVDKILAITRNDDYLENLTKQAKVHEYEKQIDQMVYKLYALTKEEIKIIEGQVTKKEWSKLNKKK